MKINKERLRQIIQEELESDLQKQQLLNENIFGWIWDVLTGVPGGVVENIKEWMAIKVMGWVGIPAGSPMSDIGANFFGNLEMAELAKIMSGNADCMDITTELAGSITEYIGEKIPTMLGVETDGWFSGAVRESMGTNLLDNVNQGIGRALCGLDFSSVTQTATGGNLQEARQRLVERFGDKNLILEEG